MLQSARRWGGVGLDKQGGVTLHTTGYGFQSARRWGGVGLRKNAMYGATREHWFQSPRRWGGVGLPVRVTCSSWTPLTFRFNPLGGAAGSGWSIWQALLNAFAC